MGYLKKGRFNVSYIYIFFFGLKYKKNIYKMLNEMYDARMNERITRSEEQEEITHVSLLDKLSVSIFI